MYLGGSRCVGSSNCPLITYDIDKSSIIYSTATALKRILITQSWAQIDHNLYFVPIQDGASPAHIFKYDLATKTLDAQWKPITTEYFDDLCLASIPKEGYLALIGGKKEKKGQTTVNFIPVGDGKTPYQSTMKQGRFNAACVVNGDYLYAIG